MSLRSPHSLKSRLTMEISPRQSATWSAPLMLNRRHGLTSSGSPAAYMQHQEPDKAEKCAIRATELGKEHAADSQLILAQISIKRNDRERAVTALEAFLAAAPTSPRAPQVRQSIIKLREPARATAESPLYQPTPPSYPCRRPPEPLPCAVADLVPPPKWLPADVDDNMPPVEPGVACPLDTIRQETGERVREFIGAVNRVSATEYLENEVIDDSGLPKRRDSRRYSYVVTVSRKTPQSVNFEEYRNGSIALADFPENIASVGLPAMVLVFDPGFRDDFEIACEGLSRSHAGSSLTYLASPFPAKAGQALAHPGL